jgi:hypothetical protein
MDLISTDFISLRTACAAAAAISAAFLSLCEREAERFADQPDLVRHHGSHQLYDLRVTQRS